MQLPDLFKPLEEKSDEELRAMLQEIRNNRTVERPAAKAHAKREQNKGRVSKVNKAQGLLAGLSKEQIAELIAEMGAQDG